MQKLKDKLPSIFGNTKTKNVTNGKVGKLETDAVGKLEDDDEDDNGNRRGSGLQHNTSATSTPTASADLTESVVRELSDPNYNSSGMEVMPISGSGELMESLNGSLASGSTNNTMNVHNAQQVVMQFSNANNLHFGSVYNFNGANAAGSNSQKNVLADEQNPTTPAPDVGKRQMPRKTTSVVVMMQSQEEPNHRMLDTIATHLGEGWKEVMRELGQSNGQIEQAVIDHQMHGGIKEVIYQLLLQWLRNADDGVGTLGYITTLLWESNHRDCVQRMKLVWKSEAKRKTSR